MSKIFLSGWGVDGRIWNENAPVFQSAKVLTFPELPSEPIEAISTQLAEQIEDNTILMGWSLGGLIAMQLAVQFPEKIAQLVLVAATPRFISAVDWPGVTQAHAERFLSLAQQDISALSQYFLKLVNYPNTERPIKQKISDHFFNLDTNKNYWLQYLHLLLHTDLRETYARIAVPTYHILGKQDAVISVTEEALRKLNSNIQITTISGAGHALFITHPDAYSACF